jgi:O-antigen/teichoic acid export membrane protein
MVSSVAFYVRVKQQYEAVIQVGMETFETTCIIVLVARHASLPALFAPPSVAALAGGTAAFIIARRRFGVRFRLALSRLPYLMKESLPLGPALLISVCYLKLDALMLAILRTPREVGLYGSAYQPIEYTFLAAAVVVNVAFPLAAAAYAAGDQERFAHLYRRGAEILLAVMVLAPVLLSLIAVPLVSKVYGPAYRDAARPMQLLSVTLVVMTLNAWQAFVLLAGGRQKITLFYNLGALAVSAIACSLLVDAYGMIGAAVATLCTGVFVLLCSTVALRRYFDLHLAVVPIARILAAAGAVWATLWALQRMGTPWPALVPALLVAYPAWLLALRVVRRSTLRTWSLPDGALGAGLGADTAENAHTGGGVEPLAAEPALAESLVMEAYSSTMLGTEL